MLAEDLNQTLNQVDLAWLSGSFSSGRCVNVAIYLPTSLPHWLCVLMLILMLSLNPSQFHLQMEGNLKKVIADLNKSRGVAEAASLTDATANPIAKVGATASGLVDRARGGVCGVCGNGSVVCVTWTCSQITPIVVAELELVVERWRALAVHCACIIFPPHLTYYPCTALIATLIDRGYPEQPPRQPVLAR